jgi:transcriptional regulator with XRE-family HTH domain
MKLRAWREGEGLSRRALAEKLSTDTATIYRWELELGHADKRIPAIGFMSRIYRLSRAVVSPNDFYDLPPIDQLELPIDPAPAPLFDGIDDLKTAPTCAARGERPLQAVA